MAPSTAPRSVLADLRDLPPLLTVAQVAALLTVHHRSVRRWLSAGTLRGVHAGGMVRVLRSDLAAFLRRGGSR